MSRGGLVILVQAGFHRDRVVVPVWVYALVGTAASTAYSYRQLYPTAADQLSFATALRANPSLRAVTGEIYDPISIGSMIGWRLLVLGSSLVAVMSVLLVVRHSRADEEQGRLELVRAVVVRRSAPLTAAVLITLAANAAVALLAGLGLAVLGQPVSGSIAFSLAWLGIGLCFAGIAAVTAQLAQTARAASGTALAVLAAAFLLRAVGDASSARWLSWLSPIGWSEQVRPYTGDRWAVLLLPAAFSAATLTIAFMLQDKRDLGSGALAGRLGPATGPRSLSGPFGLAWRLHRSMLTSWLIGMLALGTLTGLIATNANELLGDSQASRTLIAQLGGSGNLIDAFIATELGIFGLLAAAVVILVLVRMAEEETSGRADILLALPVSRPRWSSSQVGLALAGTVVLALGTGTAIGLGYGLTSHELGRQLPRMIGAALVQLPAVWLVGGIALLAYAALPRAGSAGWVVLGWCLLLGELGPSLRLPQWALDTSPFAHLPKLPGQNVQQLPLVVLTGLALVCLVAGTSLLRGRDLR